MRQMLDGCASNLRRCMQRGYDFDVERRCGPTFTATDDCGNSSSTTATFTIEDTTAPAIDMAAMDATVELTAPATVTSTDGSPATVAPCF